MRIKFSTIIIFLFCATQVVKAQTAQPNVVLIICDDLNDYEGVFGGHPQAKTPNIDRLATTGIQFMNAQSNAPVCQPSRNSLFTGVYPHDSGDFGWTALKDQPVLKNNKTLMHLFAENGYKTLGSGKLLHGNDLSMWQEWGDVPVRYNYGPYPAKEGEITSHAAVPLPFRENTTVGSFGKLSTASTEGWFRGWDKTPFYYVNENDRDLLPDEMHAQFAKTNLEAGITQPFFMGLGFVNPHTPMLAPDRFFDMFPLETLELDQWLENDEQDTYFREISPGSKGFSHYDKLLASYGNDHETAVKHFLQAYLACVAFVDEQVGIVLDALENSPYKDNTIIILTSDHGWQMGEKNYLAKNNPWEESARVPMVIKLPNVTVPGQADHPVSLIDLYPTLVDYCSLTGSNKFNDTGAELGGNSLRPFLENPSTQTWDGPRGALTIVGNYGVSVPARNQNYSYRTKDYRYIHYTNGREEIYDHTNDSREWHNLIDDPDYAEIAEELKAEMFSLLPAAIDLEVSFEDDFETYRVGTNLKNEGYILWGNAGKGTLNVSNDANGAGAYDGSQFAVTHSGWAQIFKDFYLVAGKTYTFSVASKVESNTESDRERSMLVTGVNIIYEEENIDASVNGWVEESITFTVLEGKEKISLSVMSPGAGALCVDNFMLYDPVTNVKNTNDINLFKIYPNPCVDSFYIETKDVDHGLLEIISLTGCSLYSQKITNNKTLVNLPSNIKGSVLVKYNSNKKTSIKQMLSL